MHSSPRHQALIDYSAGRLSRAALGRLLGRDVSPADAIILMAEAGLPLPMPALGRNSAGWVLMNDALNKKAS